MKHGLSYEDLEKKVYELEKELLIRRHADEVLRKNEERFRMIFEYSPLGIVHFDAGLGLTIVKEIAEKHGGEAWVEQTTKRGTTFFISVSKNLPYS